MIRKVIPADLSHTQTQKGTQQLQARRAISGAEPWAVTEELACESSGPVTGR